MIWLFQSEQHRGQNQKGKDEHETVIWISIACSTVCASTPHGVSQVLEEGLWQLVPFLHNGRLMVTEILDMLSPIKTPFQFVPDISIGAISGQTIRPWHAKTASSHVPYKDENYLAERRAQR